MFVTEDAPNIQVLENVPSGSYITTVTATDQDSGVNGEITYSFGSGDRDGFRIDSVLGKRDGLIRKWS